MTEFYVTDSLGRSYFEGRPLDSAAEAENAGRALPAHETPNGVWICSDEGDYEIRPATGAEAPEEEP